MKNVPEKIYLQMGEDFDPNEFGGSFKELNEVSWCWEKIYEHDIEYVLARSAKQESEGLREEVERLKETLRVTENQAKLYYNLYQTKGRYVDPELHTMD